MTYMISGAVAGLACLLGLGVASYNYFRNPFSKLSENELFQRLRLACINEEAEVARQILKLKRIPDLNKHTAQSTLLCIASRGGSSEIFELLVEYGADINAKTPKGDTALICAARNGHLECLEHLLERGVDIDGRGHRGWTALHWASLNGRYEIAEMLVAYGANIDLVSDDGDSCIYYGCLSGHSQLVSDMIRYGANIFTVNVRGETPMHAAAKQNGSAIKPLLEHNAPFLRNNAGETPIDIALIRGHKKFISMALEARADLLATFHQDAVLLAEAHCKNTKDLEYIIKVLTDLSIESKYHYTQSMKHLVSKMIAIGELSLDESVDSGSQQLASSLPDNHSREPEYDLSSSQDIIATSTIEKKSMESHKQTESIIPRESHIFVFKHLANSIVNLAQEVIRSPRSAEEKKSLQTMTLTFLEPINQYVTKVERFINQKMEKLSSSEMSKDSVLSQLKYLPIIIEKIYSINLLIASITSSDSSDNIYETSSGVMSSSFFQFVARIHSALRLLIDSDSDLLTTHLHFILDLPTTVVQGSNQTFSDLISRLNFEQKRNWLRIKIESEQTSAKTGSKIEVDRYENILKDSIKAVMNAAPEDLRGKLFVKFLGEQGVGAGVQREWFQEIIGKCLSEQSGLFRLASDGCLFHPNDDAAVFNLDSEEATATLNFLGRVLAMALVHEENLGFKFTSPVYKYILKSDTSIEDIKTIDETVYRSMKWVLDNTGTDDLGLTFEVTNPVNSNTVELIENGSNIPVTDSNKSEYVKSSVEYYTRKSFENTLNSIAEGFYSIIPHRFISPFSASELASLISGEMKIDLEDWKKNTKYVEFTDSSDVVVWFWNWMEKLPANATLQEKHSHVLQFVTGSPIAPLGGFKNLRGVDSNVQFSIVKASREDGSLPTASTCFNMLKLPLYDSCDEFEKRMEIAISEGRLGFSFN